MSNQYIIFVGDLKEHLHPLRSAPDKEAAIEVAEKYQKAYKFVEVIFMPENDNNTSTVIYKNY